MTRSRRTAGAGGRKTSVWRARGRTRARCGSPTAPTRFTGARSRGWNSRSICSGVPRPPSGRGDARESTGPLAVHGLALQREGALGARLEAPAARAAFAAAGPPRLQGPADDGSDDGPGPADGRPDDPRLD